MPRRTGRRPRRSRCRSRSPPRRSGRSPASPRALRRGRSASGKQYGSPHHRSARPGRTVRAVEILRPTSEVFDEALALLQAADSAVYGDSDWTESELHEEWDDLDLERDAWLVFLDGRLAGVAHLLDIRGGRCVGDAYVHPEFTGRGVGSRILELLEERSREREPEWPDGERIVLECAHLVGD